MTNPFDTVIVEVATERLAEFDAGPVDGDQLLHDISNFIARYLYCSELQRAILAAWVVHTYCHSAAQFTPYLAIQSAQKQSGKTRCLLLLHLLCDDPALTAGFTSSSLFRLMKSGVDTLLLDECQAGIGTRNRSKAPVLRAVLAAGAHAQSDRFAAHDRNRFCPKALASRAPLPEDLADLSIPIILEPLVCSDDPMTRRPDGPIERLHMPTATEEAKSLHKQLRIWRLQNLTHLKEGPAYGYECFPSTLSPRQKDIIEPLLQIADLSGGEWPQRIREALVEVFAEQIRFDLQPNIQLLAGIKDCFAHHGNPARLSTEDLLAWILALDARAWDLDGPLNDRKLARLLRPFAIHPGMHRIKQHAKGKRGYELKDFHEPWQKYLPREAELAAQKSEIANKNAACCTVAPDATVPVPGDLPSLSPVTCNLSPEVGRTVALAQTTATLAGSPIDQSTPSSVSSSSISSACGEGPGVSRGTSGDLPSLSPVTCNLSPTPSSSSNRSRQIKASKPGKPKFDPHTHLHFLQESLRLNGRYDVASLARQFKPKDLEARLNWVYAHSDWQLKMVNKHYLDFANELHAINPNADRKAR